MSGDREDDPVPTPSTYHLTPIRALFFDVDGVLTDGRIYLLGDGRELKVFDTKDGHGMRKAIAAGLKVAWISGRTSPATARRARGARRARLPARVSATSCDKYEMLCRRWRRRPRARRPRSETTSRTAAMLEAAGFSACPADATAQARARREGRLEEPRRPRRRAGVHRAGSGEQRTGRRGDGETGGIAPRAFPPGPVPSSRLRLLAS